MKLCKRILICCLIFLSLVFLISCGNDVIDNSVDIESVEASGEASSHENSLDNLEYLKQVKVQTDKNSYSYNDTVVFEIIAPNQSDYLTYGYGYWVEYWDGETGSWNRCEKRYVVTEEAIISKGIGKLSFVFSERGDEGYEKYRMRIDVSIEGYNGSETASSNEFTVK